MRNKRGLSNILSTDRKALYIILSIVMVSVLTLTVVYAALSTTLNINGNAEVTAASWDIYLDNVQLNSNSATSNIPTISNKTTAIFSTTLSNPGDFYEFTIDVVNNGSIDAMIDSVTKTPELTDTQKKYLNYIVEYQNGESIATKQLVTKKSFVRLKVKVEFRKDITASDLPTTSEILNLSFKVNYVQSDENSENVTIDNNGKLIKIISGDIETVGSEIAIGDEHFYAISSDDDSVTMLAKYNLYAGGVYNGGWTAYGEEATGIQATTMLGYVEDQTVRNGTIAFSSTNYWYSSGLKVEYGTGYPVYVYDSNSNLYPLVENYKRYLENIGVSIEEARLIKQEELISLGCTTSSPYCKSSSYAWTYSTSYWTGSANDSSLVWYVNSSGPFYIDPYSDVLGTGVRPVIRILKSEF